MDDILKERRQEMKARKMLGLLMIMALGASCERDHLYYASSNTATVLVEPDWRVSGLHPNGVSVYAFREDDGSLYRRFPPVSADRQCFVKLPEGDFTLVVMNDSPQEFGGSMVFTGEENLSTFSALGLKDETRSKGGEYCIVEPDTLAVSVVSGVHVTPEQIDYYYDIPQTGQAEEPAIEIRTAPQSVISQVNITAHVKGLKYARGTKISYLRGVAAGYRMGMGENTLEQVNQAFVLNNRKFDPGSDTDGTVWTSFLSFGLVGDGNNDSSYYLELNFVLLNGEEYPLTFDVTELMTVDVTLTLQLNLNLDIELPESVGDEEGGFDTDINDWVDEVVDIPM
ncbi:MAG: DUF5119 domain-containing protein [Candidatus Cryptobacteroides sp.]